MNFIGIDYGNKAHCVNIINMVGEKNKANADQELRDCLP